LEAGYRNKLSKDGRHKGWLVRTERWNRRNRSLTLTKSNVQGIINRIRDEASKRTYSGLETELEQLIARRDIALISMCWTWFKRAKENLGVRMADVDFDERNLRVTFRVQKKAKRFKHCPKCRKVNAQTSLYCRQCGEDIKDVPYAILVPVSAVYTKERTREDPFTQNIIEWVEEMHRLGATNEDFVFPPFKLKAHGLSIGHVPRGELSNSNANQISTQRLDQILQRFDDTMTSVMFRYGHTETLFRQGYKAQDIKEVGDWSSVFMPEIYGSRRGQTEAQQRYAQDKEA
jgi:hypothetical protein